MITMKKMDLKADQNNIRTKMNGTSKKITYIRRYKELKMSLNTRTNFTTFLSISITLSRANEQLNYSVYKRMMKAFLEFLMSYQQMTICLLY